MVSSQPSLHPKLSEKVYLSHENIWDFKVIQEYVFFASKLTYKWLIKRTPKKILIEPHREMDAKWLFLELLKYIYLSHSRESQEFVWFYWSGTSKCT
jgi:hypothetical protein